VIASQEVILVIKNRWNCSSNWAVFFMNLIQLFLTSFSHNAVFSKNIKELPLVALFVQEKRSVKEKCFPLQSGVKP